MNVIQRTAPYLLFPATMLGALMGVHAAVQRGGLNPSIAVFAALVPTAAWVMIWERLLPYRAQWNRTERDVRADLVHMGIAQILIPRLTKPVFAALLLAPTAWLTAQVGGGAWPHTWPLPLQLALMLVIAELGRYWAHRWAHRYPLLWRFHAVHHSPGRLYWLNAGRFHPVEKVYLLIPEVVPFVLLGTNIETLTLYFVFNGVHGFFQHCNIRLHLGPLNYIFSMAELHRWHHSKVITQSDNNFGNNLILWDLVFGTFYLPADDAVGAVGLYNPAYPKSYLGHLTAPFAARRLDKPADYPERPEHYDALVAAESRTFADGNAPAGEPHVRVAG